MKLLRAYQKENRAISFSKSNNLEVQYQMKTTSSRRGFIKTASMSLTGAIFGNPLRSLAEIPKSSNIYGFYLGTGNFSGNTSAAIKNHRMGLATMV
jgi:hypothetical protein